VVIAAFDSSTNFASVALLKDGQLLCERGSHRQRSHSEFLNQCFFDLLSEQNLSLKDISAIAVDCGPGSFTGIRVAGNLAKTLSYSLSKPLISVDSLRLLALSRVSSSSKNQSENILCILNAYKNLVYYGVFKNNHGQLETVKNPSVCNLSELDGFIEEPTLVIGDGYSTFESFFSPKLRHFFYRDLDLSDYPLASTLAYEAQRMFTAGEFTQWSDYLPLYIRASEAEENLQRKLKNE
jgi:tRNA threonylcarbamoyladenosine biosynthesis protein TsaB